MKILLIGLSHKTAPIEIRECLAFTRVMIKSTLTHFAAIHLEAQLEDVHEGVILSTCNRLEVYAVVRDPQIAKIAILDFLSRTCNISPEVLSKYLYIYHDEKAVYHLMRVATGLDSMVLGESQILGQVAEAYQVALSTKAAGTVLSALFRAAIHAGKRAHSETAINLNSASVSSVAANLAAQLLGDLSQQRVLLIGTGETGAIAVRALIKRGVSDIVVANRTYEKAIRLAQVWDAKAVNFHQITNVIAEVDIVITSTSAPHTILSREHVEPAMAARPTRKLLIIDIAIPRDVDSNVSEIPNIHLCNIDDLQNQADKHMRDRASEIPRVETIVEEESSKFLDWYSSLGAVSTITDLRRQLEQLRQRELDRLFNRVDLDDRQRELVATMSHRLINKILHEPTLRLKKEATQGNGATYIATTRQLFSLDKATS